MAESIEYRPPTQSQKPSALAGSIPNAATASRFVDTATTCSGTASSPSASTSQARTARALAIVSTVVKVFETTTASVSAGSRSRSASTTSVPSTFDTKRNVRSRRLWARSAS